MLEVVEFSYNIEDVISVSVRDAELFEDDEDKSISSYHLVEIEKRTLSLKVNFNDPNIISSDLLEPDTLIVAILVPQLFIDANNF